jgi:Spy/CpxP family protein refolding chaperone
MHRIPILGILLIAAISASAASPYAGQETRAINALSSDEVTGLLEGAGAGMARAAELNQFPGPKHVLELATELELNEPQRIATQALFDAMRRDAVPIGTRIVGLERELDAGFARRDLDEATLERLTAQIGGLQGALRAVHLKAHLAQTRLLTVEQRTRYAKLRGYGGHEGMKH